MRMFEFTAVVWKETRQGVRQLLRSLARIHGPSIDMTCRHVACARKTDMSESRRTPEGERDAGPERVSVSANTSELAHKRGLPCGPAQ